jgi:hypothetical protein
VRLALACVALAALFTIATDCTARAAEVDPRVNSRENPYACLGGYEALSGGGRSLSEMQDELRALLARMDEEQQSPGTGPGSNRWR